MGMLVHFGLDSLTKVIEHDTKTAYFHVFPRFFMPLDHSKRPPQPFPSLFSSQDVTRFESDASPEEILERVQGQEIVISKDR